MAFQVYSLGIVAASVCTDLPVAEATELLNKEHPTGIDSKWSLSEDKTFRDGVTPNGGQCDVFDHRRHYLFNC